MRTTWAVNVRHERYDIYIGRDQRWAVGEDNVWWGNPFKSGDRHQDVKDYMKWMDGQLAADTDGTLHSAIRNLKGKRLGCHCYPMECHGDYLAALAETL